jgi:carboxylesterase type B
MVWVYGGGFTSGSSSYYNATILMLEGISTVRLAHLGLPVLLGQMQWLTG